MIGGGRALLAEILDQSDRDGAKSPIFDFFADSFHTKKLCSRLSSPKCDFLRKSAVLRFWDPLRET